MRIGFVLLTLFALVLADFGTVPSNHAFAQTRKTTRKAAPKKPAPRKPRVNLPTQAARGDVEMAPVRAGLKDRAIRSAVKIDELVEAQLKKNRQQPNAITSDEQFVRRIHLDISGTIPTSKQALAFLKSRATTKRAALIDKLLSRPGYASHSYNYWADILRLVDRAGNNVYLRPYGDWIKECLRENKPYDKMVHEMIVAEGKVWDTPAAGFVLRDQGMPLDNLNNMVRTFLGTRIGCAQCHDHPFDKWTQREFYQLAAFVGGTEYRLYGNRGSKLNNKTVDAATSGPSSMEARNGRTILRLNRYGIWHNTKKQLRFPHDYQYDDAKPKDLVKPAVLFGYAPSNVPLQERRKVLADWIASYDNPRFSMTIANRLWKRVMGVGLFEPVDDIQDDTEASNPELMKFLVSEVQRLQFDLKEFQRILYYTKTYQRQATFNDLDPEKPYHFPGPIMRRMTAEQVWDSLVTMTLKDPDGILRPEDDTYTAILDIGPETTATQVIDKAKKLAAHRKTEGQTRRKRLYKGVELMRASELPQPLPQGHFLRQFGQSNREIISDSHTDGTVPQLLTMFNGPVTHMMLEYGSVMFEDVMSKRVMADQCDMMFLCILSRYPTEDEKSTALREMRSTIRDKKYKYAGHGNVLWALLNTREFLFIQ